MCEARPNFTLLEMVKNNLLPHSRTETKEWFLAYGFLYTRGELSYMAPLGSEKISAPYFKQCFFQGGYYLPDSQTPRLPVPRQK